MGQIAENLSQVQERLQQAAEAAGREPSTIQLMVVSKTWPAEIISEVADAGHRVFGENRLQEGEVKIPALSADLEWHFIGTLQRNKVRKVLPLFHVIHSISSMKLARYTNRVAGELGLQPRIYIELNLGAEESKHGFTVSELREYAPEIQHFENLQWQGLMCIPPQVESPEEARPWFSQLRELRDELQASLGQPLPGLSMGMSGDFEIAIQEGSTVVRVGSAIFGQRKAWKGIESL